MAMDSLSDVRVVWGRRGFRSPIGVWLGFLEKWLDSHSGEEAGLETRRRRGRPPHMALQNYLSRETI